MNSNWTGDTMQTMLRFAARVSDRHRLAAGDPARSLWWILRIAAAMCYVGHGAFGVLRKEAWLPFFTLVGIGPETAYTLMPLVGAVDIGLGVSVLLAPRRFVLLYMAGWAVWTAALRPLTGDSIFEMLERAGNFGIPIAMLVLAGPARSVRAWFAPMAVPSLEPRRAVRAGVVLAWTTALLLVGHGALAAIERKPLLAEHAASIGLGAEAAVLGGWIELALALLVLAHPRVGVLLLVALWKVATEALFPISGAPMWEFVERGGSYAAPLALALLVAWWRRAPHAGVAAAIGLTRGVAPRTAAAALLLATALPFSALAQQQRAPGRARAVCSVPAVPSGGAARLAIAAAGAATPRDEAWVAALREGGYVLACRHTKTDREAADTGPARAQQRNLDAEGERQARVMGSAIRALGIPIGEVRSSPMYRTRETSELAFGRTELDRRLRGPGAPDSLRRMLSRPVASGTNLVLMTHTGILNRVFERSDIGRLEEGACAMVRPLGAEGFTVVRRIDVDEWERLLGDRAP